MMPELGMDMFDMDMPPAPEPVNLEDSQTMQPQPENGMEFPEMTDAPQLLPEPAVTDPAAADAAVADPALPEHGML